MRETHKFALVVLALAAARCNGGDSGTDAVADVASDVTADTGADVAADMTPPSDVMDAGPDTGSDAGAGACDGWTTPPTVPMAIMVPDGGTLLLHAAATGTQNYRCTGAAADAGTGDAGDAGGDAGTTYTWTLTGPMANLADCNAAMIGTHFYNSMMQPTWQTTDGTSVSATRAGTSPAPAPMSVAWLLLHAVGHTGTGTLSNVQYVQRVNTMGGAAPATGCDGTTVGTMQSINYTADYYFYGP
jgi:hypothetical protein